MGLRQRKQTYVRFPAFYQKQGLLTAEEASGFEGMFRRARSPEEQSQVFRAMMFNVNRLNTEHDRHALLHRDDLFGDDD
jgi:hypothetical protein